MVSSGSNEGEIEDYQLVDFPPGFRFQPTDQVLIAFYLWKKVSGLHIRIDIIKDLDVYTAEPWELPRDVRYTDGRDAYYFTPVVRLSAKDNRVKRTVGSGWWHANGSNKAIKLGRDVIGSSMSLKYFHKQGQETIKTDWIMHEFRLHPNYLALANKINDETVLCRIRNNGKGEKPKGEPQEDDQGSSSGKWITTSAHFNNSTYEVDESSKQHDA